MDELKKDGLSPEEENAAAQAEAEDTAAEEAVVDAEEITEEKNELETELENLRDMFQQELDKAAAGVDSDDSGMLIQELEEIYEEEAEQEIPEEDFCECCGEKIRFKEFDEDYPYCEDCRNAMKKYPLRKSGILAFLASIALVVASVWVSYPYMNDAVNLADASANYQEGYVMTALQSYYSYFNGSKTGDGVSKRALSEIIEGYVNLGYHTNAADLINTYYSEADLKKPWNKKYSSVIKEATVLTETY